MAARHQWVPLKFGAKGTTECRHCGSVLLPNIQDSFTCTGCDFPIHKKCLMKGKGISPCTNIDLRALNNDIIHRGWLQMPVLLPKVNKKRNALNSALSSTKKRFFVLTTFGVLYYSKDDNVISLCYLSSINTT